MALQFDQINATEDQIIRIKRLWQEGHITQEERDGALNKLNAELRELYGFPPPEP